MLPQHTVADIDQLVLYHTVKDKLTNLNHNSITGFAIQSGVRQHKIVATVKMLQEQARDNRAGVVSVIGEKLMQEIEELVV